MKVKSSCSLLLAMFVVSVATVNASPIRLYVRSTANAIYGREKLRKKEKPVRKYFRLGKNPSIYYGDLKKTIFRNFETFPVLKPMTKDVIFDINSFDRITIDQPAGVNIEGETKTGRRVDFWQLDGSSRTYYIVMSIFITRDQTFTIFERMLQQSTGK